MDHEVHRLSSSTEQSPRYVGLHSLPSDLSWTGDNQRSQTFFGPRDNSFADNTPASQHTPLDRGINHLSSGFLPAHFPPTLPAHPTLHSTQPAMAPNMYAELLDAQRAPSDPSSFSTSSQRIFSSGNASRAALTGYPSHIAATAMEPHGGDEQLSSIGNFPHYTANMSQYGNIYSRSNATTPSREVEEKEFESSSEPYAILIYKALKSAPNHRMVLKEIYDWFEKNTDKGKNGTKGWQNSIRHNLSMNGAFQKVEQATPNPDGRRGYIWVLDDSAVAAGGVESTTRYRKTAPVKKPVEHNMLSARNRRSGSRVSKTQGRKRAPQTHSARSALNLEKAANTYDEDMAIDSDSMVTNGNTFHSLIAAQFDVGAGYYNYNDYTHGHEDHFYEPNLVQSYAPSPSSATVPSPIQTTPQMAQTAPLLKKEYNFEDIEGCTTGFEVAEYYFPSNRSDGLPAGECLGLSGYLAGQHGMDTMYPNYGGI